MVKHEKPGSSSQVVGTVLSVITDFSTHVLQHRCLSIMHDSMAGSDGISMLCSIGVVAEQPKCASIQRSAGLWYLTLGFCLTGDEPGDTRGRLPTPANGWHPQFTWLLKAKVLLESGLSVLLETGGKAVSVLLCEDSPNP